MNYLEDISIVDATTRLPGPLSTYYLQQLGAKVTKYEPVTDPFVKSYSSDPIFLSWYKTLNAQKKITKILPAKTDILITQDQYNIDAKVLLTLKSNHKKTPIHDLNALALAGILPLSTQNTPPLLPIGAITFAQFIGTVGLALLRKFEKENTPQKKTLYLEDIVKKTLGPLYPDDQKERTHFLHNGAFPCYNIYQCQDSQLAFAPVEKKFWELFCHHFCCPELIDKRFDQTGDTQKKIQSLFSKLTQKEIEERLESKNICLNFYK